MTGNLDRATTVQQAIATVEAGEAIVSKFKTLAAGSTLSSDQMAGWKRRIEELGETIAVDIERLDALIQIRADDSTQELVNKLRLLQNEIQSTQPSTALAA